MITGHTPSPLSKQEQEERNKRSRQRHCALLGVYAAICLLVFLMAWVRL